MDIDLNDFEPPYLIHSDVFKTFRLIQRNLGREFSQESINDAHLMFLQKKFGSENLIFPTFNYKFPTEKIFNIEKTPSEVGALTNHVLSTSQYLRTRTPVFSFATKIRDINYSNYSPFSKDSVLDYLHRNNGTIVFYGSDIKSCTYLHFVESQYGPPLYRYDKSFVGKVVEGDTETGVEVSFHVRPAGLGLDYDWEFLESLLLKNNSIKRLSRYVFIVRAREISEIWGRQYSKSQTSFLSRDCRLAIEKKLDEVGHRFCIDNYESRQQQSAKQ